MSRNKSQPTIGVDVFKEIVNDMTQQLNTNLINLNTKVDKITNRLNAQDLKINDLGQRVETLEKHITYADAADHLQSHNHKLNLTLTLKTILPQTQIKQWMQTETTI